MTGRYLLILICLFTQKVVSHDPFQASFGYITGCCYCSTLPGILSSTFFAVKVQRHSIVSNGGERVTIANSAEMLYRYKAGKCNTSLTGSANHGRLRVPCQSRFKANRLPVIKLSKRHTG